MSLRQRVSRGLRPSQLVKVGEARNTGQYLKIEVNGQHYYLNITDIRQCLLDSNLTIAFYGVQR